jgi:hypothetical protein
MNRAHAYVVTRSRPYLETGDRMIGWGAHLLQVTGDGHRGIGLSGVGFSAIGHRLRVPRLKSEMSS